MFYKNKDDNIHKKGALKSEGMTNEQEHFKIKIVKTLVAKLSEYLIRFKDILMFLELD